MSGGAIGKSDYGAVLYFSKKSMVAPESKIPKTVFCAVVLEVSSLQLNVKLFNVGSRHWHCQRPTSARCFSDPPIVLARLACLL